MRYSVNQELHFSHHMEGPLQKQLSSILQLIGTVCNVPVAVIHLKNEDTYISISNFGNQEIQNQQNKSIQQLLYKKPRGVFHIPDIAENKHFQGLNLLSHRPKLVSYWGCVLISDEDEIFGSISIFDIESKSLTPIQNQALLTLSYQATGFIELNNELEKAQMVNQHKTEMLDNLVECTGAGTWLYHPITGELSFNEKWADLLGHTLDELGSVNYDLWKSLVHPDDFNQANDQLEHFSSGEITEYDAEFRMLHKNGNWIWIRSIGKVLKHSKEKKPLILSGIHTNIDEKKKIELELLKEKERFEFATKATSDILWDWDVINNSIFFGESYENFFGYKPLTKDSEHSKQWQARLHPNDKENVVQSLKKALESEVENWEYEYRFRKQDDTYAYVFDKAYIIRNSSGIPVRVVGAFQDISLKKESELQLKVFESIINKTKDSIIITKADPIHGPHGPEIIYVNDAVAERTGYLKEELIGKTPRIFQGKNTDPATIKHISDKLRKWEVIDVDIINYSKDKKEYWINLSIVPVAGEDGTFKYCISVQKDITDRKIYERSLTELNEKLQKNTAELEISNSELEQFAYVTSHDLQEPLRMVTSFLTLLERKYSDVIDEKGKTYIHFAVDGAKRMRQLILDLLEYSRAGKIEESYEDVDLNVLMNDVLELSDRFIKEKNAIVTYDKLPIIKSFNSPLQQVFLNLINNALKYSSTDRRPTIHMSAQEDSRKVTITVEDNGIGIKQEYLEKIFIIFQRLHTKDEYSGTGIGLAITKKLMEHLGGKIWVESQEGTGSKFIIEIIKK